MTNENKTAVDLNVFDDDGVVVDGTTMELTLDQISDIIDHATQLILQHRQERPIGEILDELDSALTAASVITYRDDVSPSGI